MTTIRTTLDLDAVHLDADRYTFHPDLPGLAFVGMWDQSGGYFVPLELQARWIAYTWGGAIPEPATPNNGPRSTLIARGADSQKTRMNLAALTFARAAGVEPHLENWPDLRRALLFGPLAPSCFRLEGPDALPDAPARFARDAAAFGAITSNELDRAGTRYWAPWRRRELRVERRLADHLSRAQVVDLVAVKPRPRSTSSLCCPSVGGGEPVVAAGPGVIVNGQPG